jgi:hypothetical protein
VGAWAGGAPTSYAGHFIGATPGRALALTGVRVGGRQSHLGRVSVEYVATVIPAAFAYDNPVGQLTAACPDPGAPVVAPGGRRRQVPMGYCHRRVFGAGLLPVGTQLSVPVVPQLRLFAAANAGGVLFAENVPIPEARRLNFMFDFGGGVEFGPRRFGAITLGYKLNHISNAWTAPANPGLDHHVFYAGFVHGMRGGARHRRPSGAAVTAAPH